MKRQLTQFNGINADSAASKLAGGASAARAFLPATSAEQKHI
jgi:hypothetical protein